MRTRIGALALVGSLALGAAGQAQEQRDPPDAQRGGPGGLDRSLEAGAAREGRPGQSSQQPPLEPLIERRGQVVALRTRYMNGEQHLFAQVITREGEALLFDLGPTESLRASQVTFLQRSDLRARGRESRLGSWPVLLVEQFQLDGGPMVHVDTGGQERDARAGSSGQAAGQGPSVALGGTIEDTRLFTLEGQVRPHRFVRVRLGDGRRVMVGVGIEPLNGVQLNPGDKVWVRGQVGRINQRPVVFATWVANPTAVDWSSVQDASGREAEDGRSGPGRAGQGDSPSTRGAPAEGGE